MIQSILQFFLRNRILIGFMLVASTAVIIFLTLFPSSKIGQSELYQYDKLGHFVLFFSWTFLYGLLMLSLKKVEANLILIFITGSLFGLFIEFMQGVLPFGRVPSLGDAIADIFGTLSATILLLLIKKRYLIRGERVSEKK
jgi:VanZ family protein